MLQYKFREGFIVINKMGCVHCLRLIPGPLRHRKIFRPGGGGTKWPETMMGLGVSGPCPIGVEVHFSEYGVIITSGAVLYPLRIRGK